VPAINVDRGVFSLPDEVSYEQGTFIEPLACVLRGQKIAHLQPGQSVFILGAGISGLLHLKVARALGAGTVCIADIHKERLDFAEQFRATAAFPSDNDAPARLKAANNGHLADVVIVAAGAPEALRMAWKTVDRGGTVLIFAPLEPGIDIPLPLFDLWHDGITITPTYAGSPLDITEAIQLIRSKNVVVEALITNRLPLARVSEGFALVERARESLKVIIEP
jgi:L-iditol 2-dehydrogenase